MVPNLMIGFGIDEVQADYVAEIKLRHLNREYILKRTSEIEQLEKDIADLNDILAKPARIRRIIINELNDVAKKYGQPPPQRDSCTICLRKRTAPRRKKRRITP